MSFSRDFKRVLRALSTSLFVSVRFDAWKYMCTPRDFMPDGSVSPEYTSNMLASMTNLSLDSACIMLSAGISSGSTNARSRFAVGNRDSGLNSHLDVRCDIRIVSRSNSKSLAFGVLISNAFMTDSDNYPITATSEQFTKIRAQHALSLIHI